MLFPYEMQSSETLQAYAVELVGMFLNFMVASVTVSGSLLYIFAGVVNWVSVTHCGVLYTVVR